MRDLAGLPPYLSTKEHIATLDPEWVAMTRERALAELKAKTGQDFGYDLDKWNAWLEAHPHCMDPTEEEVTKSKRKYPW